MYDLFLDCLLVYLTYLLHCWRTYHVIVSHSGEEGHNLIYFGTPTVSKPLIFPLHVLFVLPHLSHPEPRGPQHELGVRQCGCQSPDCQRGVGQHGIRSSEVPDRETTLTKKVRGWAVCCLSNASILWHDMHVEDLSAKREASLISI